MVTTYNRRRLLEKNLESIFKQTYKNYEILILDDGSSDDTQEYVQGLTDPRIHYHRNIENLAASYRDWWAINKVIYKLMRGKYFIYLCDDEYWNYDNVLESLLNKFKIHHNLSFVSGMHAHIYKRKEDLEAPHYSFTPGIFSEGFMEGTEFLKIFSNNPAGANYLDGATLFSRQKMMESGAFNKPIGPEWEGTKWQGGYLFKTGPAAVGDVYFINKPYVIATVEIDGNNASFKGNQKIHFLDCAVSIRESYKSRVKSKDFKDFPSEKKAAIKSYYRLTFNNLICTWFTNQTNWKLGVNFNVPDRYFEKSLAFVDFFKVAARMQLFPSASSYKNVLVSTLPTKILKLIKA